MDGMGNGRRSCFFVTPSKVLVPHLLTVPTILGVGWNHGSEVKWRLVFCSVGASLGSPASKWKGFRGSLLFLCQCKTWNNTHVKSRVYLKAWCGVIEGLWVGWSQDMWPARHEVMHLRITEKTFGAMKNLFFGGAKVWSKCSFTLIWRLGYANQKLCSENARILMID